MTWVKFSAFLLVTLWTPAYAAESDVPLGATALTYEQAGRVEGCGVRLTGGRPALKTRSLWFDVSVNVYRNGGAIIQAIAYAMAPSRYDADSRPERMSVQRAWVKPRESTASTRLGENSEARDTLVYAITLDEATRLFEALANAQPLSVGVRAWGEPREWLFGGVALFSDNAREDIATCLAALVN